MASRNSNAGFALMAAIIIMVLFSALGIVGAAIFTAETRLGIDTSRSTRAFYIAEAGIYDVLYLFKNHFGWFDDFEVGQSVTLTKNIGGGSYSVVIQKTAESGDEYTYTLTSTGTITDLGGTEVTRRKMVESVTVTET